MLIIFLISQQNHYVVTPHLNRLHKTVQMSGHNIYFYAEFTKIILNYPPNTPSYLELCQIIPFIPSYLEHCVTVCVACCINCVFNYFSVISRLCGMNTTSTQSYAADKKRYIKYICIPVYQIQISKGRILCT